MGVLGGILKGGKINHNEGKKLDKYLDLAKKLEYEGDSDINHSWSPLNSFREPGICAHYTGFLARLSEIRARWGRW